MKIILSTGHHLWERARGRFVADDDAKMMLPTEFVMLTLQENVPTSFP